MSEASYCTRTQLGQLSALTPDVLAQIIALDTGATVDAALLSASAIMNGYIASRYALPLSKVSPDIVQMCADVCAYRLMTQYGFAQEGVDEGYRQRYEDALTWLRDVARGLVTLDAVSSDAPDTTLESQVLSQPQRGW